MTDIERIDRPAPGGNAAMAWGSDIAAEMLRRLGIEYIALNPGASFRGFHDSLVNYLGNRDPQLLLCLHEDHALAIAHGYAKATDRAMAVMLHANVGLMHGLLGIFNAWCDRLPVYVMGASGPADACKRRPWIEWIHASKDQGALLRHSVKWDDEPRSPQALVESMLRAAALMRTPPKGPVYVCLDVGLQELALETEVEIPRIERFASPEAPYASAQTIERAADLLVAAERPVILMGRSSRSQRSWNQRVRLAELLGAQVATDLKSAAVFPTGHGLHLGGLTLRISQDATTAVKHSDVTLLLDWIDPAGLLGAVDGGASATMISCTLDPYLHNGWSMDHFGFAPADLSILADPEAFTADLLAAVEVRLAGIQKWTGDPRDAPAAPSVAGKPDDAPISPADIGRVLHAVRGERPITLARVPIGWDGTVYPFSGPLDFLGYDGGGGLSSGPGNTIGAALGLRGSGRIVVGILGDGDFMQGATALWSAARYDIPALFVISNNRSNHTDVAHQELMARQRGRPIENRWIGQRIDEPAVDFAALARSQGVAATGPVERFGELAGALDEALDAVALGKPYLLDIVVEAG